ncbi:MAG: DUF4956 domain-containing protein [Verrucomicrobia bacterium]|nr:DUF4956 domain-containing protein [Verrucomicrobiota bacterium]
MDEFLQVFGPARVLGIQQIIIAVLIAFVLSLTIATVYRWTYASLSYSRSFVHTIVLGSVVACIMIMAIGNNLARGLGILGTLAIIRFRTPIRDPRDIIFLFASIAVGISSGAATFGVAITGTVCFCLVALYLHWSPFASKREYEGLLRFMLPSGFSEEQVLNDIFNSYCSSTLLVAMREAAQGSMIEYSYQIRLIDPAYQPDLLDELAKVESVSEVSLLMQRSTVEI